MVLAGLIFSFTHSKVPISRHVKALFEPTCKDLFFISSILLCLAVFPIKLPLNVLKDMIFQVFGNKLQCVWKRRLLHLLVHPVCALQISLDFQREPGREGAWISAFLTPFH